MSPATKTRVPGYCKHGATGHAVVRLNGKDHYLGVHGTTASREAYDRLIQEWIAGGRQLRRSTLSMAELIVAYLRHAQSYYRGPDGNTTSEYQVLKITMGPVKELYGTALAAEFGPQELKAVRTAMIGKGWVRVSINKHLGRIKTMVKWAGEEGLVPPEVYHRLMVVSGLKAGRSDAREGKPVKPVPEAHIEAVRPLVWPVVRSMIDLQLFTAMRPGEVFAMRGIDLETSGQVWVYRPRTHKTAHHGHAREIYLGPRAQEVIKPYLKTDLQAYLFSPREAREQWHAEKRAKRKSKVQPSQESRRRIHPQVLPGDHYTTASYRRAIARACAKAEVPAWHPHRLRHNAATRLRKEYGIELARVILGHSTVTMTELYAEMDREAAVKVMGQVG